jgi:hypothetical protein
MAHRLFVVHRSCPVKHRHFGQTHLRRLPLPVFLPNGRQSIAWSVFVRERRVIVGP